MPLPLYQVDAFADRPFSGNPAAVCLLDRPRSPEWMQAVGAEMNLAATAFLLREGERYRLRWFTPAVEVALCGHATLASAHVLWELGEIAATAPARFVTEKSGELVCRKASAAAREDWIEMDFPIRPESPASPPPGLVEALGATPVYVGKNLYDYFVELASEAEVRALAPDHVLLARLPVRGVIVTAAAELGSDHDFVSRFFAPGSGIAEDPATGSAHCCLAPFWAARLGRDSLIGYQASRRGGVVRVRAMGERVLLAGRALTVLRGELDA
ncbi:MAG: PhzF family phenazine biosynthesis protein [Thermoanaerobaculia bacterium]